MRRRFAREVTPPTVDPSRVTIYKSHCVGAGGFGGVFLGHCQGMDIPGGIVIKVLHEAKVRGKEEETLMREARIMTLASRPSHPCVAGLLGIVAKPGGMSANRVPLAYAMLLQYCPGGGLDRVLQPKGFFKTTDADGEVFII